MTFQLSKFMYTRKSKLDYIVKSSDNVFDDDFYKEDYYETTIDELTKELQLKDIIFCKDNPRLK